MMTLSEIKIYLVLLGFKQEEGPKPDVPFWKTQNTTIVIEPHNNSNYAAKAGPIVSVLHFNKLTYFHSYRRLQEFLESL